jgi:hypothetical protein
MCIGNGGYNSVTQQTLTPGCKIAKLNISRTAADVKSISLPLLLPCGRVSSTVATQLAHRQSRERFIKRLKSSNTAGVQTPVEASLEQKTSTLLSKD